MFGSMFYSCAQGNIQNGSPEASLKPAITVAGVQLPKVYVEGLVENQVARQTAGVQMGQPEKTPIEKAEIYGRTVDALVDQAAYAYLAQKLGADLSDAGLQRTAAADMDDQLAAFRDRSVLTKELKENATDKEWDDFFKKQTGKSIADVKKERLEDVQKQLAEPAKRQDLLMQLSPAAVSQTLAAKYKLSDEDLKKSFESITYKRIQFKSEIPGKTAAERADAALKAIQGGLKFETAIDRYSNELPTPGKKLSESTFSATGTEVTTDPQFMALAPLKMGDVSGVVDYPEGKVIYKVVSRKPALPADFERKKETYRKQAVQRRVQDEIRKELDAVKDKDGNVVFDAPGYQVAYEYLRLTGGPLGGKVIDPAKSKALFEQAKAIAVKNSDSTARVAALIQFAMLGFVQADPTAKPEDLRKQRIESTKLLLGISYNFDLRMQLIDLLIEDKQNDEASEQLVQAGLDIAAYDAAATAQFQAVSAKRLEMVSKKILNAEADKKIVENQRRWLTEKAEADKIAAEQQKEREAEAKKAAEEAKKAAEEAKKKEVPKTTPSASTKPPVSTTTGTAPAPSTATTGQ